MMYAVADPFRLDQGDVSFDAPDTVKSAMARAIAENKSHYVQTTGVPRLRELIAAKLRDKNGVPIDDPTRTCSSPMAASTASTWSAWRCSSLATRC